jgi:hypothetical protein
VNLSESSLGNKSGIEFNLFCWKRTPTVTVSRYRKFVGGLMHKCNYNSYCFDKIVLKPQFGL